MRETFCLLLIIGMCWVCSPVVSAQAPQADTTKVTQVDTTKASLADTTKSLPGNRVQKGPRQDLPMGPPRQKPAERPWKYSLSFGGELKSGNVNTFVLNSKGSVDRNDSLLSFSARYAIVYGQKNKVEYDKGLTVSLQADLWQYSRWSPFVLFTYLNNKFKGFEYKFNGLIGAKYRIYTVPGVCDYSLSAAYVQEWVEYFAADRGNERLRPKLSRLSLRFKIKQNITSAVKIVHQTFYQPSLMELKGLKSFKEDYIVLSITTIENKIGRNIFLDINFDCEYRSVVPQKVKNTDIITSLALRMKF